MDTIQVGDKVFYSTLECGVVKAVVLSKRVEFGWCERYEIKITSRSNRVFYRGYTFDTGSLHIWKR